MGFWLKLIRMQNHYEQQKDFLFLVFSFSRTHTTFFPLPTTDGGLLRKPMNPPLNGVAKIA